MLNSGCREGEELKRVWNLLKLEEEQAATWLGEEVQENLGAQVESTVPTWVPIWGTRSPWGPFSVFGSPLGPHFCSKVPIFSI